MGCDIFEDEEPKRDCKAWACEFEPPKDHLLKMPEIINHPEHYTSHPSGVECITIAQHENFCVGSALKYLWRRNLKGRQIEDLKKAIRYIEYEIERLEGMQK